jgi:hypothetical protein
LFELAKKYLIYQNKRQPQHLGIVFYKIVDGDTLVYNLDIKGLDFDNANKLINAYLIDNLN